MPISIKRRAAKDKAGNLTKECATYTNTELSKQGVESYGNAYHILNQFRPTYNGYPKDLPDETIVKNNLAKASSEEVDLIYKKSTAYSDVLLIN